MNDRAVDVTSVKKREYGLQTAARAFSAQQKKHGGESRLVISSEPSIRLGVCSSPCPRTFADFLTSCRTACVHAVIVPIGTGATSGDKRVIRSLFYEWGIAQNLRPRRMKTQDRCEAAGNGSAKNRDERALAGTCVCAAGRRRQYVSMWGATAVAMHRDGAVIAHQVDFSTGSRQTRTVMRWQCGCRAGFNSMMSSDPIRPLSAIISITNCASR